jgi:hypothetical protein
LKRTLIRYSFVCALQFKTWKIFALERAPFTPTKCLPSFENVFKIMKKKSTGKALFQFAFILVVSNHKSAYLATQTLVSAGHQTSQCGNKK